MAETLTEKTEENEKRRENNEEKKKQKELKKMKTKKVKEKMESMKEWLDLMENYGTEALVVKLRKESVEWLMAEGVTKEDPEGMLEIIRDPINGADDEEE